MTKYIRMFEKFKGRGHGILEKHVYKVQSRYHPKRKSDDEVSNLIKAGMSSSTEYLSAFQGVLRAAECVI
jgi:hypothetical protein